MRFGVRQQSLSGEEGMLKMPERQWVRTDEAEDVAASLRHAIRCRSFTSDDPQAWKWVALALHSALQGACVCHVVTTASPVGAVTKQNAREWLAYFDASRLEPTVKPPKTYLMALPDLVKAVRKPRSAGDRSNSVGVTISDRELRWLSRFHEEVRNQFVHFEPQGWSLEVSGIAQLGKVIGRIIEEFLDMGWAFRHAEQAWRDALRANLASL